MSVVDLACRVESTAKLESLDLSPDEVDEIAAEVGVNVRLVVSSCLQQYLLKDIKLCHTGVGREGIRFRMQLLVAHGSAGFPEHESDFL